MGARVPRFPFTLTLAISWPGACRCRGWESKKPGPRHTAAPAWFPGLELARGCSEILPRRVQQDPGSDLLLGIRLQPQAAAVDCSEGARSLVKLPVILFNCKLLPRGTRQGERVCHTGTSTARSLSALAGRIARWAMLIYRPSLQL